MSGSAPSFARRSARLVAVFVAGLVTGAALSALAVGEPFERLRVFAEALAIIESRYVDARDPDALVYDAIGGLTQGLDDHSIFLDPERYREIREQTSGEYYGVGISIENRGGRIYVLTPVEGSPAEEAGVLPGDEIVAVDGQYVAEIGDVALLARIKGKRGTVVVLTVVRPGREGEIDVPVRRDQVRTRSVESRLIAESIGWLKIERFQRRTVDEVKRAIAELTEQAGRPLGGLIVDVRDNPGGYLNQAVAVSDLWLDSGEIVSTLGRGKSQGSDSAHGRGADVTTPLVVVLNGGSASAAEVVAGALQDHRRATLVGYTSYGKGSVQQFFDLPDGSALKLTTARYFTPSGRSIHGSGVVPDIALGERHDYEPSMDLAPLFAAVDAPAPDWVRKDPELWTAVTFLADQEGTLAWFERARSPTVPAPTTDAVRPPVANP